MIFTFDDFEKIIDDCQFDGAYRDWFREVWKIIERRGLNKRFGRLGIIRFYRLVYQLCALYLGFTNVLLNDCSPDEFLIYLDVDYSLMSDCGDSRHYSSEDEETVKEYIMSLITEIDFSEVRELFVGIDRSVIFASLYYCLNYEYFSFDSDETVLKEILNDVDVDKMSAYEWLCGELGN